jgi:hypothetical protein
MPTKASQSLFTPLTSQEAASVSGAWRSDFRTVYYCYPVTWVGGSSSASSPSVNQTVNVNIVIDD